MGIALPKSALTLGMTGCGKSEDKKKSVLRLALEGQCAIVVIDISKGTLAKSCVGHLVAAGMERRVEYEDLATRDGRCLAWEWLPEALATDPVQRRIELELTREEFKQI